MNNVNNQEQSALSTTEVELQNFAEQVVNLCDRESKAQLSAQDAYESIRQLWLELKQAQSEAIKYTVEKSIITE